MPRSRLGPLAIESKLGDYPSQSCVWRAIHIKLKRAVAVKVFSSPFGATPEARAAFATEWESLKKLSHPAIVRCYGGGFENNDAFLAFELVDGETLAANLERKTRLSWESVLELAEPLADGLRYLHEQSILFGAIQPDKIMIAGLSPIFIDVRADRFGTNFKTSRPPTIQEIALRAPEVLRDPNLVSNRSDLYSLGATLYLALTGRMPVAGETVEEVIQNANTQTPASPASLVMDCPIWLDKLVMQLLEKDPMKRPFGAPAVSLALAEVRRRSMSKTGVAEHASSGFSPLSVTDQKQRDEARTLLGRNQTRDKDEVPDATVWHDKPWFLIGSLLVILAILAYLVWPLSETQMRTHAEQLIAEETQSSLNSAKVNYLRPMINRFPDGQHTDWATDQIDQIDMLQAEHALSVKLKRNLPLRNEGERLLAEAQKFERFGDTATALDQYRSMLTLLADEEKYRPYVNLARRQIGRIETQTVSKDEAATMIQARLEQADQYMRTNNVVAAREIWYSIIDLYKNNTAVAPLVERAQLRIRENIIKSGTDE